MAKLRYPIGIPDFERIRNDRYFYIDKTEYIHRLVNSGTCLFLSRPRRFGKSLLVSTLEAYFSGRKELFAGLAIERLEKEWVRYPVFHLDLSIGDMTKHEELEGRLRYLLGQWEDRFGSDSRETTLATRFSGVIRRAREMTGRRAVVLVDEYDNPLFSTIEEQETHEKMRDTLNGIYSVLKGEAANIHFCFLTGITRFSKMSVFSGLNNLQDLTLKREYAGICGVTQEELETCCREGIEEVASVNGWSYAEALEELKDHYDGYHFADISPDVYNPFSLIQALADGQLRPYWFASGPSQFLWKRVSRLSDGEALTGVLSPILSELQIGATDEDGMSLEALLFQNGYLTIKEVTQRGRFYHLGIPNREVRDGIMDFIRNTSFLSSGRGFR